MIRSLRHITQGGQTTLGSLPDRDIEASNQLAETKPPPLNKDHSAVVLGMFETGLGVGRSLGRAGISVIGLDASPKVGFYSRYIRAAICPHPLAQEAEFVKYLVALARGLPNRPVICVTSDEFLLPVSRNREALDPYYLVNLPDPALLERIVDKFKLWELAVGAGIAVPQTFVASTMEQVEQIRDRIVFPAFIKGAEVTRWRKVMGTDAKGIVVRTHDELIASFKSILALGIPGLVQAIIPGPDTNHFKASCYITQAGEVLLSFGLQKIRQKPVGFGFGCLIQSVEKPDMLALGKNFLTKIAFRGVGSVEFKYDERDGQFKLIELNPRYWQQNALAEKCGMNFPLTHFMDVTGSLPKPVHQFRAGVKWVNIYSDFESFREYRERGQLTVGEWLASLKGELVYSDFSWDDPLPGLHTLAVDQIWVRSRRYLRKGSGRWATPDLPHL